MRHAHFFGKMAAVFSAGGGDNSSKYANPKVEELFVQGRSILDQKERKAIYGEVTDILLDDVPAMKVSTVLRAAAASNRVQGLEMKAKGYPLWRAAFSIVPAQ